MTQNKARKLNSTPRSRVVDNDKQNENSSSFNTRIDNDNRKHKMKTTLFKTVKLLICSSLLLQLIYHSTSTLGVVAEPAPRPEPGPGPDPQPNPIPFANPAAYSIGSVGIHIPGGGSGNLHSFAAGGNIGISSSNNEARCPSVCTCSGLTVDCSHRMLTQVPRKIPVDTEKL